MILSFWLNSGINTYIHHTGQEFEEFKNSVKWRFCGIAIQVDGDGSFNDVWDNPQCQDTINECCQKTHECGHPCKGFFGEEKCLPCLHPDCVETNPDATLDENDESFCSICFISGLGDSPSIQLGCKHIFHVDCIKNKIQLKWSGPRITFLFKTCPTWKTDIDAPHHAEINRLLTEACDLEKEITKKAVERAKVEGLHNDARLK